MDSTLWALLILIILVPLALVAVAVVLDKRSQRGYALGTLAFGALVLDLRSYGAIFWQEDLGLPGLTFVIVFGGLSFALALTLGAIAETLIARQWSWLGFVVIVSVVLTVLTLTSLAALVRNLLGALGLPAEAGYLVALLPPALVAFSYAMDRSIRRPLAG